MQSVGLHGEERQVIVVKRTRLKEIDEILTVNKHFDALISKHKEF